MLEDSPCIDGDDSGHRLGKKVRGDAATKRKRKADPKPVRPRNPKRKRRHLFFRSGGGYRRRLGLKVAPSVSENPFRERLLAVAKWPVRRVVQPQLRSH